MESVFFQSVLLHWYSLNKRDLPWRHTLNPYYIWVSEIILQQTRIAQGTDYYYRFIKHFPDIKKLAEAQIDEVLKLWEGLGYYSRARNLHSAAKTILHDYHGIFPSDYNQIIKLKGIGKYTAAAIASFSFNQPYAVLDGNVFRVLSRIFGIELPIDSSQGRSAFEKQARELLDKDNPGLYNQAIMDFGALQCTERNPKCLACPFNSKCFAYKHKQVDLLPVRKKKVEKKIRHFYYLVIIKKDKCFIQKRTKQDIWNSLFEFPLIESEQELNLNQLKETAEWKQIFKENKYDILLTSLKFKHILTHQVISAKFILIKVSDDGLFSESFKAVHLAEMQHYTFPRLIHKFLDSLSLGNYFEYF